MYPFFSPVQRPKLILVGLGLGIALRFNSLDKLLYFAIAPQTTPKLRQVEAIVSV
ncbi:MAG: hypothetical protein HWQ38_06585 [Nostoc sp. NMS7]|uniref:hypothetical protein n=1 Tax=Nostoc sp. NMS7 TaxID=2815391 RepID=UPI0025ED3FE8|nr:hypothetical protein [Nostoc sp. NMS7]MBN3946159.1 hypothetical protein [Nostoc sp. NMS7]